MLNQQELETYRALTQKLLEGLSAQVYGQQPPLAAPAQNPMAPAPQNMAVSPVPQAMPQTQNPVTEAGIHVGRFAVWQSGQDKKTSFNGDVQMHAQSGNPQQPDATYKVYLYRNTDPTKNYAHSGDVVAVDGQGNSVGKVGRCHTVNNTLSQDPNVIAYAYVNFDNGMTVNGPLHRQGGTTDSGKRMPDVVGNLYFNAAGAATPAQPQAAPQQMPAPVMAPVAMPVAPQVPTAPPVMPQMQAPDAMQAFFTQPPAPQAAPTPQQQAYQQPGQPAPALNIAQMSPAQLAQFAMQQQAQQAPPTGGM